jgi:hypothetical protein
MLTRLTVALLLGSAATPGATDTGTQLAAIGSTDRLVSVEELVASLQQQEPEVYSAPPPDRDPRAPIEVRFGYDRVLDDTRLREPETTFHHLQPNGRMEDPATVLKVRLNGR